MSSQRSAAGENPPSRRRLVVVLVLAALSAVGLTAGTTSWTREWQPRPGDLPACSSAVSALPMRARLAQRLMVGVNPGRADSARVVIATSGVGGVFIGGNPTTLLRDDALGTMRAASRLPVTVAVDDEGGRVQRIDQLVGSIPSARTMAASMTPEQVRTLAAERGRELRARGVTMDLAPVVDLTDQAAGAVIGDRSFGADPGRAGRYAGAFADGLRDAGVMPVLKHFPGHGRADGDSHKGLVTTPPLAELRATDLAPYRELVRAGPAAVMVGHLNVPGLTDGLPATLSPASYRLLRTELGFRGLVLTDDLGAMRAVTDRYPLPEAVLTALRAGADVALWSTYEDPGPVLDRLQAAVDTGQLSPANVAAATGRILAAKGLCTPA